jgi:UPF0716 protein FxsA
MTKWVLLFFLVPLIEMYILIEVGGIIGAWTTIMLVVLTAVAGVSLIRVQGIATLTRGFARLNAGELPASELGEGVILGFAGLLGRLQAVSMRRKQSVEDHERTIEGDFKSR